MDLLIGEKAKVIKPVDLTTIPHVANTQFAPAFVNGEPSATLVCFDKDGRPFAQVPYTPGTWGILVNELRKTLIAQMGLKA